MRRRYKVYKPKMRRKYSSYSRSRINFKVVGVCAAAVLLVVLGYFTASMIFRPKDVISDDAPSADIQSTVTEAPQETPDTPAVVKNMSACYIPLESVITAEGLNSTVDMCRRNGFNAVVLTMKNETGILAYQSANATAIAVGSSIPQTYDVKSVISKFKENNIYIIAKIDCLKDNCAPKADGSLSVSWTGGGRWWNTYYWLNPYVENARKYVADIAVELIGLGFNEVMLDEVKCPDNGQLNILSLGDVESGIPKNQMLTQFINQVCDAVHGVGGKVSLTLPASGVYTEKVNEFSGEEFNFSQLKIDYLSPDFSPSQLKLTHKACDIAPELFSAAAENPQPLFDAVTAKVANRLTSEGATCTLRPFIQDYNTTSRPILAEDIKGQINTCKTYNCGGFIALNNSGIYTENAYIG